MARADYRTLINWGRKSGLKTSELYQAIAARPPESGDLCLGQTDCNGFVSDYDQRGQRIYHPFGHYPRS
jgi:hypothetical protein